MCGRAIERGAADEQRQRIEVSLHRHAPLDLITGKNAIIAYKALPQDFVSELAGRYPGGSPEATRRAFNKRFLLDLAEDWQQHGREVFKRVRRESPASYLKVCAMLVPREMKLEHSGGVKAMTDEEIERAIEFIKAMIAKQEAGASAKVIEGVAEPVPALPPPSRKARRKVRRSDRADSGLAARVVDAEPTDEVRQPPRDQVSPSKSP